MSDEPRKREKAEGKLYESPYLLILEIENRLNQRIFALEERVKHLEAQDQSRGLSGIRIGGVRR